jgi:hypothetical protein
MKRLLNRWRLFLTFRYTDPSLHPGLWGEPEVHISKHGGARVHWRCVGGGTVCVGGNHGAHWCTIGPGMAHEDECMCGAKRYGVFGSWS